MFILWTNRFVRFGLLFCWIIAMMSCAKTPQAPTTTTDANILLKASSNISSPADLKARFEQLATILAQRAPQITNKLIGTAEGEMPFDDLHLDADLPRKFVMTDGRVLATTLERAQPCRITPSSKASAIIFAPDPDRFQRDEESHICKGWLVKNGSITAVTFTLEEYVKDFANTPLYLVGYQERRVEQAQPLHKSLSPPGYWLGCRKIHMKNDLDSWSNEECEVYLKLPGASRYNYETNWLFNGVDRYDAAGRFSYFPDVNNTSTIYTENDRPILFEIISQSQSWVAIEDDDGAGKHHSNYYGPPPVPSLPGPFYYKDVVVDVQYANFSASWGTTRQFQYWWYAQGINDDDIWTSGCYENFDLNWNPPLNTDQFYSLNGNEFWVQKVNFPD